jgi:hypothetical protein
MGNRMKRGAINCSVLHLHLPAFFLICPNRLLVCYFVDVVGTKVGTAPLFNRGLESNPSLGIALVALKVGESAFKVP